MALVGQKDRPLLRRLVSDGVRVYDERLNNFTIGGGFVSVLLLLFGILGDFGLLPSSSSASCVFFRFRFNGV